MWYKNCLTVCKEQLISLRAENMDLKDEISELKAMFSSICSSSDGFLSTKASSKVPSPIRSTSVAVKAPSYASVLKSVDVVVIKPKHLLISL